MVKVTNWIITIKLVVKMIKKLRLAPSKKQKTRMKWLGEKWFKPLKKLNQLQKLKKCLIQRANRLTDKELARRNGRN